MQKQTLNKIKEFNQERNWKQYHTPENLAKSIVVEAAELLEVFQWNSKYSTNKLKEEIADIAIYLAILAEKTQIDIDQAVLDKLKDNAKKYPIDKSKNNTKKYMELYWVHKL